MNDPENRFACFGFQETAPWARPQSAPGYRLTAEGSRTDADWQKDETYAALMTSLPPCVSPLRKDFASCQIFEFESWIAL